MGQFRKSSYTNREIHNGKHRFEHWYRDNTIYFITSRCRDASPAFQLEIAKQIFWDRFDHYTAKYDFTPWVTTLLNNHYHTLGYLKVGENLGSLVQRLHGSVAKLVNDTLETRLLPFWRRAGNHDYFDGCIRDVLQTRRAYKYTLLQAVRAKLVNNYRDYPHTRVNPRIDLERAIKDAAKSGTYLEQIPYARYDSSRKQWRGRLSDQAPISEETNERTLPGISKTVTHVFPSTREKQ